MHFADEGEEDRGFVPLQGPVAAGGLVGDSFVELGGEFRYAGLERCGLSGRTRAPVGVDRGEVPMLGQTLRR